MEIGETGNGVANLEMDQEIQEHLAAVQRHQMDTA